MKNPRAGYRPCGCVLRRIFRICYQRFRLLANQEVAPLASLMRVGCASKPRQTYQRVNEEYLADFYLVARRALDAKDWRVFQAHFLFGAGWRLCCRQLGMDRGDFFHAVYRIERRVGRVFRELQPYALFPLDEYFTHHREEVAAMGAAA